jgi:glutamate N-acetyltransferase/amino-acid N-acetyltransferase
MSKKMEKSSEIFIDVDMQTGKEAAIVWGCDLSYDYVKINAEYRT